MRVLIVVNAYIKNKSQIAQAERLKEELEKLGAEAEIRKNFLVGEISGGRTSALDCDVCVFLDKDKAAAELLERHGLKLINSARAMEICDDKALTYIALANEGIMLPDSVFAPLCYDPSAKPNFDFLDKVAKRLSFPLVAKQCYGSLGAGVKRIDNFEELIDFERDNMLSAHLYQKFIGKGGEDTRVIVIGGKELCAMNRKNERDFRSNIELGGVGERAEIDGELRKLCEKVTRILKLDYCGIDILTDVDGERYVCEVNSNAFFAAAEKACGVNVAKKFAELIIESKNT